MRKKSHKCLAFRCRAIVGPVPFCKHHHFDLPIETREKLIALWKNKGIHDPAYKKALVQAILWHAMSYQAPASLEDALNLAIKRVEEFVKRQTKDERESMAEGSTPPNSLPDHTGQMPNP